MQFSINHTAEKIWGTVSAITGNKVIKIDADLQHVELIATTDTRRRWIFHAVFRSIGLYRLSLCIDGWYFRTVYVDNLCGTTEIPFLRYTVGDSGFIPICPTKGLTQISSGFALIRFAVKNQRSTLLLNVVNSRGESHNKKAQYVKLEIPTDASRCEDVIIVSFPSSGLWSVQVFPENEHGSFLYLITYRFEVLQGIEETISPLEFVPYDRRYLKLEMPEGLSIMPDRSAVVVADSLTFELTTTFRGSLILNLRPMDDQYTILGTEISKTKDDGLETIRYRFTAPSAGNYRLYMWFNSHSMIQQYYSIKLPRRIVEWNNLPSPCMTQTAKPPLESEQKPNAKVEPQREEKPKAKVGLQPEQKPELQLEREPEQKRNSKVEPQPEPKRETKVERERKPKPKIEQGTDETRGRKIERQSEEKPQREIEPEPGPKSKSKSKPEVEPQREQKPETKVERRGKPTPKIEQGTDETRERKIDGQSEEKPQRGIEPELAEKVKLRVEPELDQNAGVEPQGEQKPKTKVDQNSSETFALPTPISRQPRVNPLPRVPIRQTGQPDPQPRSVASQWTKLPSVQGSPRRSQPPDPQHASASASASAAPQPTKLPRIPVPVRVPRPPLPRLAPIAPVVGDTLDRLSTRRRVVIIRPQKGIRR
jgi:hypothetical protein